MVRDKLILEQFHEGNRKVFKSLFDKYYYSLKGFTKRFIDRDDICDDIIQDSFIVLWNNKKKIESIDALKSYLYTVVRNNCLTHIRDEKHKLALESEMNLLESDDAISKVIIEEEVYSEVYEAIKDLTPQVRKIVLLSMNGLTNPEIAEDLDISVNTVKTLKKIAYKKLREKLKGIHWICILMLI